MREPKFSDAPCFGKEFDAGSKICRVCLASEPCAHKYYREFAGPGKVRDGDGLVRSIAQCAPSEPTLLRLSSRLSSERNSMTAPA
jgi:hypothetical protein